MVELLDEDEDDDEEDDDDNNNIFCILFDRFCPISLQKSENFSVPSPHRAIAL